MNEIDILKGIAENLSKRECTAALSNYEVLCNNIKYVNDLLLCATSSLINIQKQLDIVYKNDDLVADKYKDNSSKYFYFRKIIPRVLLNDINIIKKFTEYTQPDDRNEITIETVGKLKKDFLDFNNLVTTARQFIDSLVADAYQFMKLNSEEMNSKVLSSLSYFNKYVTESIKQALFNPNIQNYLTEFELSLDEKKCNTHKRQSRSKKIYAVKKQTHSFKTEVDYLFDKLNLKEDDLFKNEIKNLYDFSSEFIHIGYVSTFFTSSYDQEVIFGDDIGPYLPSTENFSELKYEILKTAINFFVKVYLPSVKNMLNRTLKQNSFEEFKDLINQIISKLTTGLSTRNNQYYFFIRQGLISSQETISLTCRCGNICQWEPPHKLGDIFCKKCGSKFNFIEVEGDPGYIVTSRGLVKVLGSNAPDFNKLSVEEKTEFLKKYEEAMNKQK